MKIVLQRTKVICTRKKGHYSYHTISHKNKLITNDYEKQIHQRRTQNMIGIDKGNVQGKQKDNSYQMIWTKE